MTITNANFDDEAIEAQIRKNIVTRDELRQGIEVSDLHDACTFEVDTRESI